MAIYQICDSCGKKEKGDNAGIEKLQRYVRFTLPGIEDVCESCRDVITALETEVRGKYDRKIITEIKSRIELEKLKK